MKIYGTAYDHLLILFCEQMNQVFKSVPISFIHVNEMFCSFVSKAGYDKYVICFSTEKVKAELKVMILNSTIENFVNA